MISRDEWLAAVAAVSEPVDTSPEAITMAEFADLIGLKPSAAKVRMRALVQAQKARPVRKQGHDVLGRPFVIPAYVLIKETPDAHPVARLQHSRRRSGR
jgi:hypothetical protein